MTALETLQKYGLKTDVKSIRERLLPLESFKYFSFACNLPFQKTVAEAQKMSDELRAADLALLCELAEKGERWERAVKDIRPVLGKMLEELWQGVEVIPKSFFDKLREYMLSIDKIITEAEGEGK